MSQLVQFVIPVGQLAGIAFGLFIMIRGEYVVTKLGAALTAVVCASSAILLFRAYLALAGEDPSAKTGWMFFAATAVVFLWFVALFWFPWLIASGARRGDRIAPEYYERHRPK